MDDVSLFVFQFRSVNREANRGSDRNNRADIGKAGVHIEDALDKTHALPLEPTPDQQGKGNCLTLYDDGFIKANTTLSNAFEGGQPEVSVFWTVDGVRFKARFDYLKLNAITDLKSIANRNDKEFAKACRDAVASYDYIISAEHYTEGRRQLKRLLNEGRVFGSYDPEWLAKVAANEVFAFVFVFWQKDGAPISHGIKLSPGNPLFSYARSMIAQAVDNYRTYLAEFGTETAWVPSTPLEELDETDLPVWYQQRLMTGS